MLVVFLSLHILGLVGFNILLRKSLLKNIDGFTLATIMQTGMAIPMFIALFFQPINTQFYSFNSITLMTLASVLVIGLQLTNVKALQYLEVSVYSVLFNLRIIFTTILGILFLGERIIPLQILGGLLIFLAIFLVKQKGDKKFTRQGIFWGFSAAMVLSILNTIEKTIISSIGFFHYALPVMILCAVFMWIALLLRKNNVPYKSLLNKNMAALMALRALAGYGLLLTFSAGGKVSVANYISSLSVIIIVILGIFVLNEKDYLKRKLFATSVTVLGLTAILIANL